MDELCGAIASAQERGQPYRVLFAVPASALSPWERQLAPLCGEALTNFNSIKKADREKALKRFGGKGGVLLVSNGTLVPLHGLLWLASHTLLQAVHVCS